MTRRNKRNDWATEKQLQYLEDLGYNDAKRIASLKRMGHNDTRLKRWQASELIDQLKLERLDRY